MWWVSRESHRQIAHAPRALRQVGARWQERQTAGDLICGTDLEDPFDAHGLSVASDEESDADHLPMHQPDEAQNEGAREESDSSEWEVTGAVTAARNCQPVSTSFLIERSTSPWSQHIHRYGLLGKLPLCRGWDTLAVLVSWVFFHVGNV
jgi:hypothetical protein